MQNIIAIILILGLLFVISLLFGNGVGLIFGTNLGNMAQGTAQIIFSFFVIYLLIDDIAGGK